MPDAAINPDSDKRVICELRRRDLVGKVLSSGDNPNLDRYQRRTNKKPKGVSCLPTYRSMYVCMYLSFCV